MVRSPAEWLEISLVDYRKAWTKFNGTSSDDARRKYVTLVSELGGVEWKKVLLSTLHQLSCRCC